MPPDKIKKIKFNLDKIKKIMENVFWKVVYYIILKLIKNETGLDKVLKKIS